MGFDTIKIINVIVSSLKAESVVILSFHVVNLHNYRITMKNICMSFLSTTKLSVYNDFMRGFNQEN